MKRNSKLSLALHALGHMAAAPETPLTSAQIAQLNATNPVVVRRVLGLLRDNGLVRSEKGHAGGWWLARQPDQITLAQVYRALDDPFYRRDAADPSTVTCEVEIAFRDHVNDALRMAEAALVKRLSATTIAALDLAKFDVHARVT